MSATALAVLHKFIRREMFDFSQRMFRAAPRDVPAVQAALRDVAALLHTHATQEEARLEPLLRSLDAELAERVLRDHDKLDAELARLCTMAEKLDPDTDSCVDSLSQLHLDWNRFLGAYLLHLDDEERTLFVRLQEHMPLAAIAQSPAAQDPEQGQSFLDRLWAVTTPMERSIVEHARDPRTLQHTDARFNSRIDVRGAVRNAIRDAHPRRGSATPYFSAAAFNCARPDSKSSLKSVSILTNTVNSFDKYGIGPSIDHTTFVPPPLGNRLNCVTLLVAIGSMKSRSIVTVDGVTAVISIRPVPTSPLPVHS